MEKVLVIVGPTASGKSALGVELARRFGGEIISADSRQVYRGLDIGTGKITKREMRGIPHHLLDVASPKKCFSAKDFKRSATKAHYGILQNAVMPIVVGGTGYYIDAFLGRVSLPEVPPNEKLRSRLAKKTPAELFALLQKKDPRRAASIEPHNQRRLIRALEIASALGAVPAVLDRSQKYGTLWIGIKPSDVELEKKIRTRLLARIRKGMIAEAKRLHAGGLSYKRMEELGLEYRSLARYLKGVITKEEMVEELCRDIRRYAKKQMAYWKRNKEITWFDPSQKTAIGKRVSSWLKA